MNWDALNSLTKYPSIPPYHKLVDGQRVDPADTTPQVDFGDEIVYVSEKIDGTNGRIVLFPGYPRAVPGGELLVHPDWAIGSREELLSARGDRIPNSALFIVEKLAPWAEKARASYRSIAGGGYEYTVVLFAEVYGAGIGGSAGNYSKTDRGARLFDVAVCPVIMLEEPRPKIAAWREAGGQHFLSREQFVEANRDGNLPEAVPLVGEVTKLPRSAADVREWLGSFDETTAGLDGVRGLAEGVVVRTADRSRIAKIRFDDYLSKEERLRRKTAFNRRRGG